jgi:hypothetical protein
MKLDDNGAAYFVELIDSDEEDEEMSPDLATSPIPQDSWLLMETHCRKKRTNSCSSSSSSSSHKSISRRKLELIPVLTKKPIHNTIAIQTDRFEEIPESIVLPHPSETSTPSESVPTSTSSTKGKLNRKKRRRRDFVAKHSRNKFYFLINFGAMATTT